MEELNTHSVNAEPFAASERVSPATQGAPLEVPAVYASLLTDVAKKAHTSDPELQDAVAAQANAVVAGVTVADPKRNALAPENSSQMALMTPDAAVIVMVSDACAVWFLVEKMYADELLFSFRP